MQMVVADAVSYVEGKSKRETVGSVPNGMSDCHRRGQRARHVGSGQSRNLGDPATGCPRLGDEPRSERRAQRAVVVGSRSAA